MTNRPEGDECQCVTCGRTFADEAAFIAHMQRGKCPYVAAGRAG